MDRGGVGLAMAALGAVIAVLTIAVSALATLYAARAQAEIASDSAALAAAVASYPPASSGGPLPAADSVVRLNGAVLSSCRCPVDATLSRRTVEVSASVTVHVPVFGEVTIRRSSRAEFDPAAWLGLESSAG